MLLNRRENDVWEVILRPGKRAKIGSRFVFGGELKAEVLRCYNDGNRLVRFEYEGLLKMFWTGLEEIPLPLI